MPSATKEMLINTIEDQECRIAIVSNGSLEELYVERRSSASHVGNIYKGRVTNVEPAIQAAFVDFGLDKNGFLHVSDLHPKYFPKGQRAEEPLGQKRSRRDRPPIQACLRRGQEVLVQVTKEGIGTKGPTLTSYLSLPGRLLVLMPGMTRLGVSRKIEDEQTRNSARDALAELTVPADMGVIVRTAGAMESKRQLQRDLNYLKRLWNSISKDIESARTPCEIYQESDLIARTIRDVYNTQIKRIICDSRDDAIRVKEFLNVAVPRSQCNVEVYVGKEGLFHDFGLEEQIERIHQRQVPLPSGGSLVIDQTEALVAIDVNSGRYRDNSDAETTALKMNSEAAPEIARQLRLRDLGGVIVIDFIDMYNPKHCRSVERVLREAMKADRAKTKVQRMSTFGIIEMTRQRMRPSLRDSMHSICLHCKGAGLIKSPESQALEIMRDIQRLVSTDNTAKIEVTVTPEVAEWLSNRHRTELCGLEAGSGKRIIICAEPGMGGEEVRIVCTDQRGSTVQCPGKESPPKLTAIETISVAKAMAEPKAVEASQHAQAVEAAPSQPTAGAATTEQPAAKKKRSRRGGRRHRRKKTNDAATALGEQTQPGEQAPPDVKKQPEPAGEPTPKAEKKTGRRRGSRGGSRRKRAKAAASTAD